MGDLGSIPGLRRSSGEENSYLFQYSGLENSKGRGVCQATVHGVAELNMAERISLTKYKRTELHGFRKGRTTDQIANIHWIMEKSREFQKITYFCLIDYTKAFDFVNHNKLWKYLKRWEYQTSLPASCRTCMPVRKQQLELYME